MSAIPKQMTVSAETNATTPHCSPQQPDTGPSRRRRRANHRLGNVIALCAMGAWGVIGLMPVVAALYAYYGY